MLARRVLRSADATTSRQVPLLALPLAAALACGPRGPVELPEPDVDVGLGDVVMMTWTTREADGLLGHALSPDAEVSVDATRRVIEGQPREVSTDQTLRVVVTRSAEAAIGGGYGPVSGEVQGSRATHVAYDVRITGYLEYPSGGLRYVPASGCCMGGEVSGSCGYGYVARLVRGTGTARQLEELSGKASVRGASIVRAEGGASFRVLSESSFSETYFAYEVAPLAPLCARLAPEEELEALAVDAPKNCFLTRIDADGERSSEAFTLPSAELCARLASKRCAAAGELLSCEARFGGSERSSPLSLESSAAPAPPSVKPASELPERSEP